jgi:undecaprenyl-diphosphatase
MGRSPVRCVVLAALAILFAPAASAQSAESPPEANGADAGSVPPKPAEKTWPHRNLFARSWSDQKFLVSKWWPAEIHRTSFAAPLLAGIAFAATSSREDSPFDQDIEDSIHSHAGDRIRRLSNDFSRLGDASTGALLIGTAYGIGRFGRNERLSETASLSAEALLDAGVWITVLKTVAARARPTSQGEGDFFTYHPKSGQDTGSFPSGHAMGAFAVASVVSKQYPEKRWVSWVMYGTATLIGTSRVVLARHYPSDVVVGAVLGNSIGRMVVTRARGDGTAAPPGRLEPIFDRNRHAVGIRYHRNW